MIRSRRVVRRDWIVDIESDIAQVRAWLEREDGRVLRFAVQLELNIGGEWRTAIRYDNAHGFCHRDLIRRDGTTEKTPIFWGDNNQTFTTAMTELRREWKVHYQRLAKRDYQ